MFQFASPWLALVVPIPVLVYWFFPAAQRSGAALKVPFFQQVTGWQQQVSRTSGLWRKLLLALCWFLIVAAACRPQWVGEYSDLPVSGRDLMLAVDVSGSMKAQDMFYRDKPQDRLSAVKRVAGEFIQRRTGDRIGLILFGTKAYLQAPLSLDRKTVNQLLQESAIGIAGEKTAIGDAVGLALKRLKDRKGDEKILVLLTDGSQTAGQMNPVEAARLASLGGMRIHTIGVGSDGSNLGGVFGGGFFSQRNDLDEATLKQVAEDTGGQYFRATDAKSLERIYALIDELEPIVEETSNLRPVKELFYLPLGAVLLISMLWTVIATRLIWINLLAANQPSNPSASITPNPDSTGVSTGR